MYECSIFVDVYVLKHEKVLEKYSNVFGWKCWYINISISKCMNLSLHVFLYCSTMVNPTAINHVMLSSTARKVLWEFPTLEGAIA